ncbi:MAG: matrixin family metalloprotease, partial [Deltaproteobacteria bacterium]|nr:matrixin family metalloprotease [Deltaproteobacteria bacterium]
MILARVRERGPQGGGHPGALAAAAALLLLLCPARAAAFCRTTTCDRSPTPAGCTRDDDGCSSGTPLFRESPCLSFSIQKDGSPRRGIGPEVLRETVSRAFQGWLSADCGGGRGPDFSMWDLTESRGFAACDEAEFNPKGGNANVWLFLDEDWPHPDPDSTLALTTVSFAAKSGRIYDADVELNSFLQRLTTSDTNVQTDLASVVAHEAGHFLGLAHSRDATATMSASYLPGSTAFRTLHPDDVAGICATFPPGDDAASCRSPTLTGGYSGECQGGLEAAPDSGVSQS